MRRYKIKAKDAYTDENLVEDKSKDRELYIRKENQGWTRYKVRMPSFDRSWTTFIVAASILAVGLIALTIGLTQNLQNQIDRIVVSPNNTPSGGILSGPCDPITEICNNQTHYNWLFF